MDPFFDPLPHEIFLYALVVGALVVQLFGWGIVAVGWLRARRPTPDVDALPPVSVVVAARDEAQNLPTLLDALLAQTHPTFEVVLVDDGSTDGSAAFVERQQARWAAVGRTLRLLRVPDGAAAALPRKKYALTQGIAAAHHERLAFTDADTQPGPDWLRTLARHAADAPDAVLVGYGPYRPAAGLLNAFVRYETLVTATLTAAAIGLQHPFMAVGRNLSYPKALFEKLGGFAAHARSLSGDDDLFVQQVAREKAAPVYYVFDPASFVPSEAPATGAAWVRQKQRHASAGRFYPLSVLVALGLLHGTSLLTWIGAPLLFYVLGTPHGFGFLALRLIFQRALVLQPALHTFQAGDLSLWQLALDPLHALYTTLGAPLAGWKAPKRW